MMLVAAEPGFFYFFSHFRIVFQRYSSAEKPATRDGY